MKVTEISRTISFGNFENISMTAKLDVKDDVSEALLALENKIKDEIEKRERFKQERYMEDRLTGQIEMLTERIAELEGRKVVIEGWFDQYEIPLDTYKYIPF